MSWKEKIRSVEPYVSGEQPNFDQMIKLNTNENPYPPSRHISAVLKAVSTDKLALYPSADADTLRHAIAQLHGLNDNQVFIGNGSDEVLSLSFLTFFNSTDPIFLPDVTYPFYTTYCDLYGITYKKQNVDQNFHMQLKDYTEKNGGIIFCNPCNPTGIVEPLEFIEQLLLTNSDSVVIIDEAYADFASCSAVSLLKDYENLLITKTFSKARSLAGIRLGYALGSPFAIQKLYDVKNSFNSYCVDRITQQIGLVSVHDHQGMIENINKIIKTRTWFLKELHRLGFVSTDSKANFVFVSTDKMPAKTLYEKLYDARIIVRYWDHPGISDWIRITIGTDDQMICVLNFLKKVLL